ncbi:AraC family transcriptional regulator [Telluribacter humicola]|uniref:AraC family transcriptional regulator n=1 Tax=Telluribacter humicola TaxID=1720261 RepID=UPI001A965FD1|nr:AraC family transcriptional regulator [Telluribacter humicola]
MVSPSYRLINPQANRSFIFKWEPFDLTTRWHYHPELELIYFIEGKVSGVMGDGFREFDEGEVVLLGANFPHVLQPHSEYTQQYPTARPFGLIIQFTDCFLGEAFINCPELQGMKQLFERARRGIRFGRQASQKVAHVLNEMPGQPDSRKLMGILHVLLTLSETVDYDYLTHQGYHFDHSRDEERMWQINQYVYRHFTERITIADVAAIANMSETAFCRYFKSRTLKHFTRYLNEIRIAYACKLLQKPNYTVTEACFEAGFNSLSYFNRQFKEIMQLSPQKYRQWAAAKK